MSLTKVPSSMLNPDPSFNSVTITAQTASRAAIFDASKGLVASSVTSTELGYVSGVTSSIQTQLSARVLKSGDTMTGALTVFETVNFTATGYNFWRSTNYQGDLFFNYNNALDAAQLTKTGALKMRKTTPTESSFQVITPPAATGDSWSHILKAANQNTEFGCNLFLNGPKRTADGGANMLTLRNDGGPLRLGNSPYNTLIEGATVYTRGYENWDAGNFSTATYTNMIDPGWNINNGSYAYWGIQDFVAGGNRMTTHARVTIYHQGDYNHFTGFLRLYNLTTGTVITDVWGFVGGNNGDVMNMNFGLSAWVQIGQSYRIEIQITKSNGNGPSVWRQSYQDLFITRA